MVTSEFPLSELLDNTELLLSNEEDLSKWMERYPFVSIFQSLKAKAMKDRGDLDYDLQLKKAAITSPNREMLYEFLIQPHIQKQIAEIEKKVEEPNEEVNVDKPILESTATTSSPSSEKKPIQINESQRKDDLKTLERQILAEAVSASIHKEAAFNIQQIDIEPEQEEVLAPEKNEPAFDDNTKLLDWLKATSTEKPSGIQIEKSDPAELIDSFIKKDPQKISIEKEVAPNMIQIDRPKREFFSPENMAKMSVVDNEHFITETLAGIYAQQGHIKKAIKAYEILVLKFPEKSDYFAALIKELNDKH
ncbi:MAG: hypothetical protein KDC83_09455 [Flavobacteriales bacterium]|nr:hypothetical protein [Flavobacteriales bacterium]